MTHLSLLAALGCGLLTASAGGWLLLQMADAERLALRIRLAQGHPAVPARRGARRPGDRRTLQVVGRLGAAIVASGLLPRSTIAKLEETLTMAGFRAGSALGLFIGAKLLLVVALPALAALLLQSLGWSRLTYSLAVAVAAVIGLLTPDYLIGSIRRKHLAKVELGLPDALDMMVICAEAGLGLEPSIARVAVEIAHVHPALAQEMSRTSSELQMMSDSRIALANMGARTGLACLTRLGSTLIQTMQYGTPLSGALRMLATELRQENLTKFEERAARLPVLLTLPMILFILPCVFLIVGGPAVIRVMQVMK